MINIRHSEERGKANHGWLQTRYSFSFAGYHDPKYMGVSALRVINDDQIAPGRGFATHSHQDMEIISYVTNGAIEHKDSMGNTEVLPAGEVQLMSAGTGVTHSEYNPSTSQPLTLLQIWIEPDQYGIKPGYQQKRFANKSGLQLIVSPDARDGSLKIQQDAFLYQLRLVAGQLVAYPLKPGRTAYVQVVAGGLSINGVMLSKGDGAEIKALELQGMLEFAGREDAEVLVFDLP